MRRLSFGIGIDFDELVPPTELSAPLPLPLFRHLLARSADPVSGDTDDALRNINSPGTSGMCGLIFVAQVGQMGTWQWRILLEIQLIR